MAKAKVDVTPNFYRVRFHDPKRFKTCRIPAWATKAAGKIKKGAKTTQCKTRRGEWKTQSVLVPKKRGMTKRKAVTAARKIYRMLEKKGKGRKKR